MAERNLPPALKTSLVKNDSYTYFHLIKFERPNGVASSNFVAGKATDYAYITDSSINIEFNDDSKSSKGVANGPQTYVANKVLKVGTVNETTEAKASNMNLVLSGTALGTIVTTSAGFASSSMTTTIDLLEAGFQEGDILLLESAGNTNNNKYARIDKFTNANKTVALTGIDCTIDNAVSQTYNLSYASEEISALLNNKEATNYTNYVNREVFIYRGHFAADTLYESDGTTVRHNAGDIIGKPFVIFKGIISKGSVQEDVLKDSKVSWNLTSHWGDFVRVQGRLTSDYSHRALSITGGSDVGALIRPEYQYDLGFAHAERAVNLIATYQTQETRYKMKKRGGFAGFIGLKKTVEYQVEVDREVDLQFNLTARSLPVVYGVQKVDSIPVFADILEGNAKEVYVAHAFAEGEIGGIFDVHIEDTSSVCLDQNDKNNRTASDGVNIACYGRADQGFVLAGQTGRTNTQVPFSLANEDLSLKRQDTNQGGYESVYRDPRSGPTLNIDNSRTGLQHETTFSLHHAPTPTTIFVHTGKADQDADDTLVKKASNSDFKLQNQLSDIDPNNYWSPNHKLLDTAYVVAKYVIGEGETTISKLEFVVSGKKVRSYNYDHSYDQDSAGASAGQEFFNIGDEVTIHRTNAEGSNAANSQIGSTVTIIDKWSFYRDSTTLLYRFRLSANPQADTNSTAFYIKRTVDGAEKKWHMVSHDHKVEATTLTVSSPMTATVTNIPAYSSSGGNHAKRVITLSNLTNLLFYGLCQPGHFVSFNFSGETPTAAFRILSVDTTNKKITVVDNDTPSMRQVRNAFNNLSGSETCTLRNHNLVNLSSSGSTTNDAYNNRSITFTRFDSEGNITHEEEREIVDYAVNTPTNTYIATVSNPGLPFDFSPGTVSDDSYTIQAGRAEQDIRVSINPAIQLLDYLKNKRYGKGLDDKDINLPTFLQAARDCDTRSDVTLQIPTNLASSIVVGDVYKYPVGAHATNPTKWQGTVKSATHRIVNIVGSDGTTITPTDFTEIVFTNIIGKFGRKWNNWETFEANELFWHLGKVYYKSSSGVQTAVPTTASVSFYNSNLSIGRVSGTGPSTLAISITDGFTSSGNPIVKSFTSAAEGFNSPGYSLYDSDDVKYWKYLGWDDQSQRFVTRHQTNQIIDTSVPLFDNINSMLKQFNGILRYSGGKYELAIKSASPSSFETFQTINDTDIIGKIKLQDKGQKGIFNSMSANVVDPQNNYNARSITYFNSDYLKEDKGIRRSGQFAMPGISNYFNSRINIKQFLDESRYGLDIAFTLDSKAYLLLTGEIIRITNERFGWSNKLFRIDNLNFQANGLVQVTATEHNDAAYLIGAIKTPFSMKDSEDAAAGSVAQTPISTPAGLTGLTATSGAKGAIDLAWTNSTSFNTATHTTEVWASSTNDRTNATLIYTTQSAKMSDIVAEQTLVTKFYWVRHTVVTENGLVVPSAYFPTSSTAGVQGTATGAIDGSDGSDGARGAGRWHIQVSSLPTTSALANTRWGDGSGNQPSAAVVGDQAFFYTGTLSSPTAQKVWIYAGSSNWTEQVEVIDGDLLVQGTVTADRMNVTTLSSITADIGSITAGTVKGGSIPDANTAPSGTEAGAFMDLTNGKMVFGKADKHILFDGTNLQLSGVIIDETSVVNSTAGVILQEDGTQEATTATTLNFTTGLNVAVTGSAPTQTATISLDSGFATLNGSTFTGSVLLPDQTSILPTVSSENYVAGTGNNDLAATTRYVEAAISSLINGAPGTLNTLNELAEGLNDDDDAVVTINTALTNRLRVDTSSQNLSSTQKANALTNLGISAGSGVTSVSGTLPISVTSGATPTVSISAATTSAAGSLSASDKTQLNNLSTNLGAKASLSGATFSGAIAMGTNKITGLGTPTSTTDAATKAYVDSTSSSAAGGASGTTYTVSIPSSTTKLRLSGSDSTTDDIEFVGSGATTVTRTNDGKFTISSTDTNTDTNTNTQNQYAISCVNGDNSAEEKIRLSGSGHNGSTTDDIVLEAGTGLTIARTGDKITFTNSNPTDSGNSGGTVTSVGISHGGNAFNTGSAVTTSGTLAITMAGSSSQYVNGSGNLVTFPTIPSAANNATITISAGTDLTTGGDFTTDQSSPETITIDHANISRSNTTSTATPAYSGTFTAVDSITTNARGHITAVNTKTVTIPASDNTQGVTSLSSTTTNQLTVTDGSTATPELNIVTGAVANSGTALATGDQIHTFVTGQGFVTSSGVTSVATNNGITGGTITGTGTIGLSTNNVTNASVSGSTLTLSRQGASNVTFTDNNDNTTYDLSVAQNTDNTNNNPRLLLAGTNSTNDHITMIGGGAITTTRDSNTQFTISHSDTNSTTSPAGFSNADSLATSGKVKLLAGISHDTYGHITGSNGLQLDFTGPVVESSSGVVDIVASTITATNINSRFANFGSMAADVASITNLTTDFLDADQIISKDIRVGASDEVTVANFVVGRTYKVVNTGSLSQAQWNTIGGTTEKIYGPGKIFTAANVSFPTDANAKADDFNAIALINGSTLTGSGAHLNSDGDFFVGVHDGARIFFDQSTGTMTVRGTLNASDINTGTLNASNITVTNLDANSINGMSLDTGSNGQLSIGSSISAGNHSVILGAGAGGTGLGNTSIGKFAGGSTTGTDNVAIGQDAGMSVTTGDENIMIGSHTGRAPGGTTANKTGNNNIGIGAVSNQNTANGTLSALTSGSNNIVFGKGAGRNITTGSGNVIIGGYAGVTNDESTITIATGTGGRRLYFDTSGNATFTGTVTGNSTFTGTRFFSTDGTNTLSTYVSGSYNQITSIGSTSGGARDLRFNFGQSGTVMTLKSTQVHMAKTMLLDGATTNSTSTSNIISTANADTSSVTGYHISFTKSNGTTSLGRITTNNTSTTYTTTSDYRLKEDLVEITGATAKVLSIPTRNFKWIGSDTRTDGFLAHELAPIVPDAVVGEKDAMTTPTLYLEGEELPEGVSVGDIKVASVPEYQSVDQSKLVPLLVKTIQELEARITALENP